MTELRALTSARGVAAWMVVLYHIRGSIAGLPAPVEAVLAKGYLAVDFFFLLSGFVIWLNWHERVRDIGILRFLQKRLARIWPLHAVMLTAALLLALLLRATGRTDPAFPLAEIPLHLLLIQNWGLTTALHWNDPAWSISCELAAYLLFPLPVLAVDWRRIPTAMLLAIAAALLLALHWIMRDQPGLGADIPRFGLVRCLAEFGTGTIVAALWLRGANRTFAVATLLAVAWYAGAPETLAAPATFALLLLWLATLSHPSCRTGSGLHGAASSRPVAPEAPWTPEQVRSDGGGWLEGTLYHLGEISYATYLSHFLLWKVFKLAFVHSATVPATTIAVYLFAVLATSAGLYRYVEKPAQRRLNALPLTRGLDQVARS